MVSCVEHLKAYNLDIKNDSDLLYHFEEVDAINQFFSVNGSCDPLLLDQYQQNRSVSFPVYVSLAVGYLVFILVGIFGNVLLMTAILRRPAMRTGQNMLILNLALSDILLCSITMPSTFIEVTTKYFTFGKLSCKLSEAFKATNVFTSTFTILAIALDRYNLIVFAKQTVIQHLQASAWIIGIWIVSAGFSVPLFLYRDIETHELNIESLGITTISYCYEMWPVSHGRTYYSLFSMFFQYIVPVCIVSIAYRHINRRLRTRMSLRKRKKTNRAVALKMRRTRRLLNSIAVIFAISWIPLNICNISLDLYATFLHVFKIKEHPLSDEIVCIIFGCCHLIAMTSACSNPILYGWLNDNIRAEFQRMFCRGSIVDPQSSIQRLPMYIHRNLASKSSAPTSPIPNNVFEVSATNGTVSHVQNEGMTCTIAESSTVGSFLNNTQIEMFSYIDEEDKNNMDVTRF